SALATEEVQVPTSILVIDGTNIENRCREAFNREDIDFRAFFAKVAAGTRLLQTHYFTAAYSRRGDQRRLADQSGRFNVIRSMADTSLHLGRHQEREVRCRECGHTYIAYAEKGT